MELHSSNSKNDLVQDFFENFDLKLALYIFKKSKTFILLAALLCFLIPYLYIRYSIPVFETTATLIKKKEIRNNILDEKSTEFLKSNDDEKINRDIQIIKSDYLLHNISDSLGIDISYYKIGRIYINKMEFLSNPTFNIAPNYKISNAKLYNIPIDIKISNNTYSVTYQIQGEDIASNNIPINQPCRTPYIEFTLHSSKPVSGKYQIVFNDQEQIKNQIVNSVNVTNSGPNIYFNIKSTNSQKSELILNKLLAGFLREDKMENSEKIENSLQYIKDFVDTLNIQLRKSQVEKATYSINNNIYLPEHQITSTFDEILQSRGKIEEANDRLRTLDAIKSGNFSIDNANGNNLQEKDLIDLYTKKEKLLLDYKADHPVIQSIDKLIADKIAQSKRQVRDEIALSKRKLNEIQSNKSKAQSELRGYPEKDLEFNKIQKEVEIKEKYVLELLEKQIQYLIIKSSISSDYLIIQPPKTKEGAISPKKAFLYLTALFLFICIALLIVLYRYIRFDKIVSLDEVKRKTKVPILGYLPFVEEAIDKNNINKNAPESRLVVIQNPKSRTSEIFKKMRASLKYTSAGDYRTVASTSTISGEGKTFLLINLAAVHAQLDKKVVIIDLDLRKPRISKSFKLDNELGMSNLLSSQVNIDDCIQRNIILPNLDVITSGPIPPNPSELIINKKFDEIIDELKKRYDYIFIDTPPVGLVNESIEIINKVDIPLYLIRFNYSGKDFLNSLNEIEKLKNGSPLFLVINHFGEGASSYVNYNYGGYSYHYGYSYGYNNSGYNQSNVDGYYTGGNSNPRYTLKEKIINFFDWTV